MEGTYLLLKSSRPKDDATQRSEGKWKSMPTTEKKTKVNVDATFVKESCTIATSAVASNSECRFILVVCYWQPNVGSSLSV
jgi:hypothetical protein